jgi:hypothetical protein
MRPALLLSEWLVVFCAQYHLRGHSSNGMDGWLVVTCVSVEFKPRHFFVVPPL